MVGIVSEDTSKNKATRWCRRSLLDRDIIRMLFRLPGDKSNVARHQCQHRFATNELAITIVVDKSTTRTPRRATARNTGGLRNLFDCSVSLVVVQTAVAVIRHIKIVESVVVITSHADALNPSQRTRGQRRE